MEQQFFTTMMMMMSGNNVFLNAGLARNTLIPRLPLIRTENGRNRQNGDPNNDAPNNGEGKEEEYS